MTISSEVCDIQVSLKELGLTRDRFTRSLLRQALESRINAAGWSPQAPLANPPDLDREIENFAERHAVGAAQNVGAYFSRLSASGYTIGGRRVSSQALLYLKTRILPSAEDVGSMGEGIAGYYLENRENLGFELRPLGVSPDFIFRDPTKRKILVEVKTSLHEGRVSLKTAISLLEIMAKTKFIRAGQYVAYVVQVNIKGPQEFELRRLSMKEVSSGSSTYA